MTDYVKSTNFTAKDTLPQGDANKVIRGSEFDTEFNAIQVAVATKADLVSPTFSGTATFADVVVTGNADLTSSSVTVNIDGGTIDNTVIGATTPAAGTFTAVAGTTGTFSGAVTGSNLNVSNWDTAYGWGDHGTQGYLTNVAFTDIDAGAVTLSSETFADVDNQIPTNAAVIDYVSGTIPLISEVNDLSAVVTWDTVPDEYISASSVTQHIILEKATQTKTYTNGETSTITLSEAISSGAPVVAVTKEIPQTGATNNNWDVDSTVENYTRYNSAPATTLSFPTSATAVLGSGSFASADVGKTIEANGGTFVLTATDGSVSQVTAPTSYNQVASGSWGMFAIRYNTTDGDLELTSLITPYSLSAATYDSVSLSLAFTQMTGTSFNNDGTKLFAVSRGGSQVYEYSLSTAYDIATATYVRAFAFNLQQTNGRGLLFNPDGTKMYISGSSSSTVSQYTLTTGFDLSTASYANKQLSIASQDSLASGMAFNSDGTVLFVVGSTNDRVNKYTLSTAYDVSTGSFSSYYDAQAKDSQTTDIAFTPDGTTMFLSGYTNDKIYKYSLTGAFDISSPTFISDFAVGSEETQPMSVMFNSDGSKMYVTGEQNNKVFQYTSQSVLKPSGYNAAHTTLSTDSTFWTDINSMTADEAAGDGAVYYCVSTDDRTTWKIAKGTDGERSIVRNNSGTWQYNSNGTYGSETWANATTNAELPALQEAMEGAANLTGTFDVSTVVYSQNLSVASQDTVPEGIAFNTDGTKMFIVGSTGDDVNEYALSTGFDVSTASFTDSFSVASQDTVPQGIDFNTNGTKMFIVGSTGDDVNEYTLTTGFDVSTASYSQNFSVVAQDNRPYGIAFNADGTKMFVVGNTAAKVMEYTLSTGFDVSTASFVDSFSVSSQDSQPQGLAFNTDGTKMFVAGNNTNKIYEYALTTGFDVSSSSFTQSISIPEDTVSGGVSGVLGGLAFNTDGTKMFVVGSTKDAVYEYNVGTTSYTNQMNKTQLDAVPDANQFTLGNDLDLAIIFNMSSGSTAPSSDGVSINYDANTVNQGAVLGTDYNFDFPATDKVRITSLGDYNLKVRII
jgi:sugar lactone lactonase YvrE